MEKTAVRTKLVLVLLAGAMLAACGGSEDEPVQSDGGTPQVEEGDYRSTAVEEDGAARPLVEGTTIALRLVDGRVVANAGCNTMSGEYEVDGGVLLVDSLATTEMGCDPPRHEQDAWLADVLISRPTISASDDGFDLTSGRTTIRFADRRVVEPDVDLVGTTWEVTGFIDGDVAMSAPSGGEGAAEVVFGEDGFVTGHDGCNGFGYATSDDGQSGLRYAVDGDEITFEGDPASTEMACPGTEEDVERFHAVLRGTVTVRIEASSLTLIAPDGRGVTYGSRG
jgi:heat shock protein HslJ